MKKIKKTLGFAIILTELSHIFCCVLPTLFSVLGLLAGVGMIGVMPLWLEAFHKKLHGWELPIISASGVAIVLGWALYFYAQRTECHDHSHTHDHSSEDDPCTPKKSNTNRILTIATVLFGVNVFIYLIFHYDIIALVHG